MIQIKRHKAAKEQHKDITITRIATGEKMRLFCENEEQRKQVEKSVLKLFKVEVDNVVIVDEAGNMVKMVEP